jgi:hypothetical protein
MYDMNTTYAWIVQVVSDMLGSRSSDQLLEEHEKDQAGIISEQH